MYRSISDLTKPDMKAVMALLTKKSMGNIHVLSAIENLNPETSMVMNMQNDELSGIIARIETPEYPLLFSVGCLSKRQVGQCFCMDENFILVSDETQVWSTDKHWRESKVYEEHLMFISTSKLNPFQSESVRLLTEHDAAGFLESFQEKFRTDEETINNAKKYLDENDCFGLFIEHRMVSRGRIQAKSSYGWAMGGLYTAPEHRNKGYATSVVSRILEYAFGHTDTVILFVRKDNFPAASLYGKMGSNYAGRRFFVDYKTGEL